MPHQAPSTALTWPAAPRRGVLVTRPEPGASETAARLAGFGWEAVLAPALVLEPVRLAAIRTTPQAVLLGSRAAARMLTAPPVPVLAVGEATAAEARRRGFADVRAAAGDAAALARLAAASLDPAGGPLLLAVGEGYGAALAADLRARGFRVLRRVAYRARAATGLPAAAAAALRANKLRAALFFSPRTARCSVASLRAGGLGGLAGGVVAIAISPRVAHTLASLPWGEVRVAPRPDQDALLETLGTP